MPSIDGPGRHESSIPPGKLDDIELERAPASAQALRGQMCYLHPKKPPGNARGQPFWWGPTPHVTHVV